MAFLIAGLIFLFPLSTAATVFINEVAWMGTLPKEGESVQAAANNEWIELFNDSVSNVSLGGWRIASEDGMPDILLSGLISAGGYFLLERASDEVVPRIAADLIYPYKNNALSNSGERLFLKDAAGNTIDEINVFGGWPAGDNETKDTMQRQSAGWITGSPTPRVQNVGTSSVPDQGEESSSSQLVSNSSGPIVTESISAYAGEDKKSAVGSTVDFLGAARGINGESLENARFWWNFGDGGTKEGRAVSHIFEIPGKYVVGLHVSSGTYSSSDYLEVSVTPNQLAIKDVLQGEGGFIKFQNPSGTEVDIGGWVVTDGKIRFVVPPKTKIGSNSETAFVNKVTGLFRETGVAGAKVFYSNGVIALEWRSASSVADSVVVEMVKSAPQQQEVKTVAVRAETEAVVAKTEPAREIDKKLAQVSVNNSVVSRSWFLAVALLLSLLTSAVFLFVKWRNQKS